MFRSNNDLYQHLGFTTRLRTLTDNNENTAIIASHKTSRVTRAQERARLLAEKDASPSSDPQSPRKPKVDKKRNRNPEFTIFVDADSVHEIPTKKSRPNTRQPLLTRLDSANSTPCPSPRLPSTPFPLSDDDPLWADRENYHSTTLNTPPQSPSTVPTTPSPAPGPPPPQPRRRSSRLSRARGITLAQPLPQPQNMVLYDLLDLQDWSVGVGEVRLAYRRVVVTSHPDKVHEEQRAAATEKMQMINGAKEVLLDEARRLRYHVDGTLPWAV